VSMEELDSFMILLFLVDGVFIFIFFWKKKKRCIAWSSAYRNP
jgi:hypothetical protein